MTARPRALLIADETAWPRDTGYRQRLHSVVRALRRDGEVDCVVVAAEGQQVPPPPDGLVRTFSELRAPWLERRQAAVRWAGSRSPHWVTGRDWRAAREGVRDAVARADLVWVSHLDVWAGLAPALAGATVVVDVDNVMSVVTERRAQRSRLPGRVLLSAEAWRWRRLERRVAGDGATVVVCSDVDAGRFHALRAPLVVPNGYDAVRALDPAPDGGAPRLLLVASFDYPPNADAAEWAARDVLPAVRARHPDAVLRLVGRASDSVRALGILPGVEVVGRVDEVSEELERSSVVVCPIRWGGGTRIKVVEAFAARRPVVSTSIGCEGLTAVPGQDLLVADDAESFALACARLLDDASARHRLAEAGHRLWERSFRWPAIEAALADHVTALVSVSREADGGTSAGPGPDRTRSPRQDGP